MQPVGWWCLAVAGLAVMASTAHAQTGSTLYRNNCTSGCHASSPASDRHPTLGYNRLQQCARTDVPNAVSCLEGAAMRDQAMGAVFAVLTSAQINSIASYLNSVFITPPGGGGGGAPSCTLSSSDDSPSTSDTITLRASCTNSPTGYSWTNCTSTTSTCQATRATAGLRTYSVTATNAQGTSPAASLTVTWTGTTAPPPAAATTTVVEYFHAGFGHYFMSSFAADINALDSGAITGWSRTGRTFKAYADNSAGQGTVCRFFTAAFAPKSSHFYTSNASECTDVRANNRDWQYEGESFFVQPADVAGSCPAGTVAVYRLYNMGQTGAPNHRYTTDPAVRAEMMSRGWQPEGSGAEGVGFCAPL